MNYKLVKSNKSRFALRHSALAWAKRSGVAWLRRRVCALLVALALLTLVPNVAVAHFTNVWFLDVVTNYPGSDYPSGIDYNTRHALIQNNARWGVYAGDPVITTNISGQNVPQEGPYCIINFITMTNYYVPSSTNLNLTNDTTNTYYYIPYTNTLSVTITGTNGVVWSVSSPSEWINSSAYKPSYTDNFDLVAIPTGSYTITFPPMSGWTTPSAITTNITVASPFTNSITGAYVLSTTSSTLTVQFMPIAAQSATWWVYDNTALIWYGPFIHNGSKSLTSSNDYTVSYSAVRGYKYSVSTNLDDFYGDRILTNTFLPYSNNLAVTIAGLTFTTNVTWTLAGPAEFTNSVNYGTTFTNTFTNTYTVASIPTGNYAVTFPTLAGYTLSSANPQSTNIVNSSPLVNSVTGTYTRQYGTLQININPAGASNATWTLITKPDDYTNLVTGTGTYTIANAPVGNYTVQFNELSGWTTPANASGAVSEGATRTLAGTFTFLSYNLIVNIGPPYASQASLPGKGAGYVIVETTLGTYSQTIAQVTYPVAQNTEVRLTAYPDKPGGASIDSFVYKWYRDIGAGDFDIAETLLYVTNYNFSMASANTVWLLFSKELYFYDNVGDIDQDGLPDEWEIAQFGDELYGGPAEDDTFSSGYGRFSNPDGDFIPSASPNPPMLALTITNILAYSGQGGDAGYPLLRNRLLTRGEVYVPAPSLGLGYASGIPFDNYLECRGIDTYYLTNVPPGSGFAYTSIYGDDPRTDPDVGIGSPPPGRDTDGDTMSDGWEYYFWYWRSAGAYAIGITNSANLSWVVISPIVKPLAVIDTDLDGLNDTTEFQNGTDPTHCDTDADGMDDTWEINTITPSAVSNALDSANWSANPDGDYYATVSNVFVLTTGMVGTAFANTNAVCYSGTAANPAGVWVNIYTNTGSNVFDLYRDTILKATVALTNRQTGTIYTNTVFYGTNAGLGVFQQGYPVWVDMDTNGVYSAGDYAIVNPPIKHEAVYLMAPASNFPGVTSFDPRTAWTNMITSGTNTPEAAPNTVPYTTYQEYLGGDYIGRMSWDAGGQMTVQNDPDVPTDRNSYTLPNNQDTDVDRMPDGWELYVGLNPNNAADAGLDGDGDGLFNFDEWANATHALGSCAATWPNKPWPTDPGVITAPSPNDPHPQDTDWDGLGDNPERSNLSNPTAYDTDGDGLPDGWEVYAGANVTNSDATLDYDGDGLLNYQEYWTGTVPEWQYCDATWGVNFMTRKIMPWDSGPGWFIPPDFLTDGSFMFYNGVMTNIDLLRTNYPAAKALSYVEYHTTLANNPDSDGDGMDDYWEVYHGLNPNKGLFDMMMPAPTPPDLRWSYRSDVDNVDADPGTPGFQVGERTAGAFNNISNMIAYVNSYTSRWFTIAHIIGPFNFGLQQMDPDGDGLPNLEEYSYSPDRTFYHTDPTPIWRTDSKDAHSFVRLNYGWDYMTTAGLSPVDYGWNDGWRYMFRFEEKEGFDSDNDGMGDYAEINAAAGELGNNPLDERNPIRNRALYVNGTTDFVRTPDAWTILSESFLTKFCVEAWIKPDNPARAGDQVVLEKAGLYRNPYDTATNMVGANFRLGITNGLPYVLYNGRGALQTYQATAQIYRLTPGVWAHIAGVYDGATLTLYVNGEFSMALRTTELPATGVNSPPVNGEWYITAHSIMVGARDLTCGRSVPTYDEIGNIIPLTPASYFGGCIDEVRIWDGARSQAQVIANKNRRIPRSEMTNSFLVHYYSFDDVPDPLHLNSAGVLDEPVAPFGLTSLDTIMSFHPPMAWWAAHPQRSTVYSGWIGAYNYLVSSADHVAHMSMSPPQDDPYHFSSNYLGTNVLSDYNNFSNPYEIPATYGRSLIQDMVMFMGAHGVATNSWLDGLDPSNPDSTDTDGDGLPDWWEQLYGLDPNDATGDNGAWGDPDHDGLNNRAEYLAGTDPFNSDTFGTGIGDYDYPRGVYSRTYGEMFTDGDGMPDDWESQNGLDPQKYDANLDLDGDGWSNYAEYQAHTNPNNKYDYPQPLVFGVANYYGNRTGMLRFYAYEINTMDGVPQITKVGTDSQVAESAGKANGTFSFTGLLPIKPIDVTTVVRISAPLTNNIFVTFTFTGPETFTYSGVGTDYAATLNYVNGKFTLRWASVEVPAVGANVSVEYSYVNRNAAAFSLSGFKEGDFYMLSLLDVSGNGSFDAGEPMGIMDDQPVYLSYSTISGIRVLITDTRPGFGRFTWTGSTLTNAYPVVVNKISESGAPTILQRAVTAPRNYFHEWDFHLAGIEGLMAGTYQWWMGSQNGTFSVNWPASLAKPGLVYPRGDVLYNAQNQFAWTMDLNCPRAHFQVARGAVDGALVTDKYIRAPWMDAQGVFRGWLDDYASDWGNGVYYWRVAGWTPQGESAWSDWQTFHVDLSAANSRWISGDIYYFGKAPATKIIVEAFDNRGFGGRPVARMTLTPPASTGWVKCSYTLRGLEQFPYFVRAFLDITPAGSTGPNSKLDAWESVGFYRDPYYFYQAGLVNLSDAQFMDNAKIIIRDKDTDNDKLPDAWEMYYFGNLDQTGDMDYDGDGETNLDEYIRDGVNQNPANWDTDGDGLSDGFEKRYNGAAFGFARSAKAVGTVLNPNVRDTDGDGYSDGAELLRYHTDPLDPTSYPRYRPLCTDAWPSPGDYDGDGRSDIGVYDFNAGVWHLFTMAGQSLDLPFGNTRAQPMVGDYTGDGCSEFAFYDKGLWSLYTLSGQSATMQLGDASMLPAPADYTGDGRVDLAVFDTNSGTWYIYDIWSGALFSVPFGASGMIPVPGDYNGDGAADLVLYEPATGNWLLGCYHKYYRTWTVFGGTLGGPTWMPVPGDYDGDGRNDVCLFESSTGRWMLFTLAGQFLQGTFGWKGCVPVPGDYDGDGRTDLGLYDTNTGMWYIICMSGAYYEGHFGWPGALPILKGR